MNALIAAVILAQFTAAGPNDHPPPAALMSPTASARYALERVCGPAAAQDEQAALEGQHGLVFIRSQGAYEVMGVGHVLVRQEAANACYFRVGRGDPQGLRRMVLETLTAAGANPTQIADREVEGRAGRFRQETYCLDFSGRSGGMLISTALGRGGYRLQVTLIPRTRSCPSPAPAA